MSNCKVVYDYDAKNPDELSLKTGEIVTDVDTTVEGGWWEGVHPSGVKGWFPDNFVEKVAGAPPPAKAPPPTKKQSPAPPPPAATPAKKQCRCTFGYDAQSHDELSLKIGDIVDIISQEEEGWWEGSMNGKSGMFPNNFVEEISSGGGGGGGSGGDDEAPPPSDSPTSSSPEDSVKAKKVEKVGFGNIFGGGGMPVLRKTGTFSNKERPEMVKKIAAKPPPSPGAKAPAPTTTPTPAAAKLDIVKVEFDYDAQNPDELSLAKGEFLNVLKRDGEGWWEGQLMVDPTKKGWFPDNFVAAASDSEKAEFEPKAPTPEVSEPPVTRKPAKPEAPTPKQVAKPPPPAAVKQAVKPPSASKPPPPAAAKSPPPPMEKAKPPPPVITKAAAPPPAKKAAPPVVANKKPPPAVAKKVARESVSLPTATVNDGEAKKTADAAMATAKQALELAQSLQKIVNDSHAEIETLKKTMSEGLDKIKGAVKMLTTDVDEEKTGRAKLQIELDRLKKLVQL